MSALSLFIFSAFANDSAALELTNSAPTPLTATQIATSLTDQVTRQTSLTDQVTRQTSTADASPWPAVQWPLALDPAIERRMDALLAEMSLEAKVGQTIQGDIGSITPADVRQYGLGSILAGGNSDPNGQYNASPAQWLALADAFYAASLSSTAGQGIPILFGIDAVHGQSNIVGATLFPHNIGLGATRDVELMRRIGEITAIETRATGMEWAFAPTVAVPQDDRWGRTYEGYSESPELVASFSAAVVEGLQGKANSPGFLGADRVMVSVKHFVGDGGTTGGKDQGDTAVSEQELARLHGAGYPPAIAAGAQSVMASFNSFNGVKMHGHTHLLSTALKSRMQFGGFVVGDWNGHAQVTGCTNLSCPASFNAGVDMFMAPDTWKGVYASTLAAAKSGAISIERLDDAVRRILRVKFRLGLFDGLAPSKRALGGKFGLLGAAAHRLVARQAVRESLVLLKNNQAMLPLDPRKRVLVAGDGANNMSKQAGGWTLSWQGSGTTRRDFPNADTIFEGIAKQVKAAGGSATLAVDGKFTRKPDYAIVVIGEDPYAEFQGDISTLAYKAGNDADLNLIRKLRASKIPVVVVFLSGRPLWVNREINAADAFVAAWLPGSEGAGIADVLLRSSKGDLQHDFKGKLSFSWPKTAVQYQNNVGQANYDPQFAFGYGLTYASRENLGALPEISGLSGAQATAGVYFQKGVSTAGMRIELEDANGTVSQLSNQTAPFAIPGLRISQVDHQAQEDARRLQFASPGAAWLVRPTTGLDLARESNGDVLLVLTVKITASAVEPITIGAGSGKLSLNAALQQAPTQRWFRLGIALKCFAKAGANLNALDPLVRIQSAGAWDLSVARLTLGAQNEADHMLRCDGS
jgi:beta-glucosidase